MAIFSTSAGFESILTTGGEQAHLKGFPSSERGNNTIWHNRQNGQTATEQPAQTQVEHEHRCLSGRRGRRVFSYHSHTGIVKSVWITECEPDRAEISTHAEARYWRDFCSCNLCIFRHSRYCTLSKEKLDLMNEELENGLPEHVLENRKKKKNKVIELSHILLNNPKSLSDRFGH